MAMYKMEEQQMEVDSTDAMQLVSSGYSGYSLELVPRVDDTNTHFSDLSPMERFIKVLDHIDGRVECLRKEAILLQQHADLLTTSIDLLKNHENINALNENERDEVECYVARIGSRLATIELCVRTVRNSDQEDSLHQVNSLIDELLLTNTDPVITRQKCQQFLNACSASDQAEGYSDQGVLPADKKFESALLGCTLDDQKHIKKRLLALLEYLYKQTVSD